MALLTVKDSEVRTAIKRAGLAVQTVPAAALRRGMGYAKTYASADHPHGAFQGYTVPLRQGQKYQRTGKYGSSFSIHPGANNQYKKSYTLINTAPYAVWVGGSGRGENQAGIHAGRWPLIAVQVDKAMQEAIDWAAAEFNRVLMSGAGGL